MLSSAPRSWREMCQAKIVRGFAVTLVIGLLSNLFTAVYVSRTIFAWHISRQERGAELSI